MRPSDFLADFFAAADGSIYLCSLANERGKGQAAEICGRGNGDRLDELVCQTWDRKDRGTFFCVNTLRPRQSRRSKETVHEICCAHADIDFGKIDLDRGAVLAQLNGLPCLPSKVVDSGHGLHPYWLLNEALPATPENIARAETLLRSLSVAVGGDPAVCEVARLMRLPGSYNTKNGDRLPVTVIVDRPLRYELSDLAEWLEVQRPVIPRKGAAQPDNPFLAVDVPGVGGAAVDVDARLQAMRYQGAGDTAIHQTQLAVSAAMLNRGAPVDATVDAILTATRAAAGEHGAHWSWDREARDIRAMCASWKKKKSNGGAAPEKPFWQSHSANLEELDAMEFKPVSFLVPGLIPAAGVTLICSKPKHGKSWLLYDLCISAAANRDMLGDKRPLQGHTLYLALEDSQRRLQERGRKLLPPWLGGALPQNARVAVTWPRVDQDGLDHIREWVLDTRAAGGVPVCVAIDVLKMIRPAAHDRKPAYDRDYEAIVGLRSLAQELSIAIVVAHHTRKLASDDPQDTVSGTLGLTGAADTVIVMVRQADGSFVFDVRGRDVEAAQLAAALDKDSCRWRIAGEAADVHRSEGHKAILAALAEAPDAMTPKELAAATGLTAGNVNTWLWRLAKDGKIAKRARGKYARV